MNQKELLLAGEKKLRKVKENAYQEAKLLLQYVLKQTPEQLVRKSLEEVDAPKEQEYKEKLEELMQEKPIQYITNKQEFMGLNFYVDENVLIPQPDTEILVEETIKRIKQEQLETKKIDMANKKVMLEEIKRKKKQATVKIENQGKDMKVLDLCTGSGAIGISIANYVENCQVTVSDISKSALEIAKKNALQNQVENKIKFVASNLFEKIEGTFNYIVSNPPYIPTSMVKELSKEVQKEPKLALDGGKEGLDFYKIILKQVSKYLTPKGFLLLEIGYNQAQKVIQEWKIDESNLALITKEAIQDLGGNDRVLIFQKK